MVEEKSNSENNVEQEIAQLQQILYQYNYQLQQTEQRLAAFTEVYNEIKNLTDDEVFQLIGDIMVKKKRADVIAGYEQRINEVKTIKQTLERAVQQEQEKLEKLMKEKDKTQTK